MARKAVNCAVSIALALAGINVFAQTPQKVSPRSEASHVSSPHNARIILLLEQLAEQARASENPGFAVRAQSQAAALLWSLDPEQARLIYRRAFDSIKPGASPEPQATHGRDATPTSNAAASSSEKRRLRRELLNQIAIRDSEFADQLARDLIESAENACGDARLDCPVIASPAAQTPARESAERRELLLGAAFQVLERDPQQAMAFAQMSLAVGVSPNLARLLTMFRNVDHERADLLFSNALERLRQSHNAALADIHTLGSYVVSTVNSAAGRPMNKTLVAGFLNFAVDQITQRDVSRTTQAVGDDSALYFISRQLTDLATRYQSDRLAQLQRYLIGAAEQTACEEPIDPGLLEVSAPSDIMRDARDANDERQRNALYARAALASLGQAQVREAQDAAGKISDEATRDRVLIQIARRCASDGKTEDALALARRISDLSARVDLLVLLSGAASSSKNKSNAIELLSEAESCVFKGPPTIERARSLVKIANSFSSVDPMRSFSALESAVTAINEIIKRQDSKDNERATQPSTLEEICSANFESTLAALAEADFDRALILAQQLDGDEAPVLAQLAVLRGGLAEKQDSETAGSEQ
jgi:hypothetical protein